MIDTIKGYLDLEEYSYTDFKDLIKESKITIKGIEQNFNASFNLSNFKITIKFTSNKQPIRLYFNGSLSKFYYGNNLAQLDWNTTKVAIKMLSDNLNVDISKAKLTRVDFGINMNVNNSVHEYISCLISFPRLDAWKFGNDTIKFLSKNGQKTLIFYDKIKEIKHSSKETFYSIPYKYRKTNILRYEIQLKKNLKKMFELDAVYVNSLFDKVIQDIIANIWFDNYYKIIKLSIGIDPKYLLYQYNGVYQYLSYHGISRLKIERVMNTISELNFNVKNPSSKRSKMKSQIKQLLKNVNKNSIDKNLIHELDDKIKYVKQLIF